MCNLVFIVFNMYVKLDKIYDFKKLKSVIKVIVRNLNKIIDINYYLVLEVWVINYVYVYNINLLFNLLFLLLVL